MKIFLSAVSAQFSACRKKVRSDLAAIGCEVKEQEDFQMGPRSLIEWLEDYVVACDRIIALVGDAYGFEASGDAVPARNPPRSYTQWEYYFALGERLNGSAVEPKDLFVYFASHEFLNSHPVTQSSEEASRQSRFAQHIKDSGKHYNAFGTVDELRAQVLRDGWQIKDPPRPPVDEATRHALGLLQESVLANDATHAVADSMVQAILHHAPRSLNEFHLHRIAAWSHARYALDKRFTPLSLLIDRGREADGVRWQAQQESFSDLRDVLKAVGKTKPAIVVLGPPGSGKSTLLRRLELDLATDAIRASTSDGHWTLFVSLGRYHSTNSTELPPLPEQWLAAQWAHDFPHLPAFDEVLRSQRLVLLLDGLNEMPHGRKDDYRTRVGQWRDFVTDVVRRAPGNRIVLSCRSLDYSESLSTPDLAVPHVRIEHLSNERVKEFLFIYSPEHGGDIWTSLLGTPQLDLFRSPFYLKMLLAQVSSDGKAPQGRATLFTGFVRQALTREVDAKHPLFQPGALLHTRDHARVVNPAWRDPYDLPSRGPLMNALSKLAFGMQQQREGREGAQVRIPLDDALTLLGGEQAEALLEAGVALQVLEDDRARDEVLFVHQLLQEYFAARTVAASPKAELGDIARLATTPWRETDLSSSQFGIGSELPTAPQSGWEETFILAAAMAPGDAFVTALMEPNLPLAGRCAAGPEVRLSPERRATLQQALIARSRDPAAHLRTRIAAAQALAELGDPRFDQRHGRFGDYLMPPLISIPGGTYSVGSHEGMADERPVHTVEIAPFAIGQLPVTNAEWRFFMNAGGYDEERWWQTEGARRWRSGEARSEDFKSEVRETRESFRDNLEKIRYMYHQDEITYAQAELWEAVMKMNDAEFEAYIASEFPLERKRQPELWSEPLFNHPSQPVVGVCWYEVRAFCAWLSAQSGQTIRLPTEAEWEVAARGRNSRRYAWGSEFNAAYCNVDALVRGTTPIGVFPGGDTPEGLVDMVGNVLEWTSSAYKRYPYDPSDGREDPAGDGVKRVARGASWQNLKKDASATYREGNTPDTQNQDLGFRVVCVSPVR